MVDLKKLLHASKQVEDALAEIRESIGAPLGQYEEIKGGALELTEKEVGEIFNPAPRQPFIDNEGNYYILYIKDHLYYSAADFNAEVKKHPSGCFTDGNKVHFYECGTWKRMKKMKRVQKYRFVRKFLNRNLIDLRNNPNEQARLAWCKNCINILLKHGNIPYRERHLRKPVIAEFGNAQELMNCVIIYQKRAHGAVAEIKNFVDQTVQRSKT